jgi:hypothetical protein
MMPISKMCYRAHLSMKNSAPTFNDPDAPECTM